MSLGGNRGEWTSVLSNRSTWADQPRPRTRTRDICLTFTGEWRVSKSTDADPGHSPKAIWWAYSPARKPLGDCYEQLEFGSSSSRNTVVRDNCHGAIHRVYVLVLFSGWLDAVLGWLRGYFRSRCDRAFIDTHQQRSILVGDESHHIHYLCFVLLVCN